MQKLEPLARGYLAKVQRPLTLVRIAGTLHRFRAPTPAAFNDIMLSELHDVFPKLLRGIHRGQLAMAPVGAPRGEKSIQNSGA